MIAPHALDAFAPSPAAIKGAAILFDASRPRAGGRARACRPTTSSPGTTRRCARCGSIRRSPICRRSIRPRPAGDACRRIHEHFGDEVIGHLEFIRFNGKIDLLGLPLVRFTTEERLAEIIDDHEAMGAPIFNPHRYTLEEGGMKQTDAVQLAFKRETDPHGLLNPGKMIAWEDPNFDYSRRQELSVPGPRSARARRRRLKRMRILVLFAHPVETSFAAALHARSSRRLRDARP